MTTQVPPSPTILEDDDDETVSQHHLIVNSQIGLGAELLWMTSGGRRKSHLPLSPSTTSLGIT
jgi:hypothetical protein